jgi:guanine nucleotide-binding protein subunit alpha
MPGVVDHDQARRVSKGIDDDIKVSLSDYMRATSYPLSQREKDLIKKRQKQRRDVKGLSLPRPSLSIVPHTSFLPLPDGYSFAVILLGQAESGKSTLQKQFQLYHASPTLDRERPSWRPIVYFNAIKAVRTILDELDWDFTTHSNLDDDTYIDPSWSIQISRIRHKLLPLVTIEDSLASELSGGVTVAGGRSGVFVRAGWQSVVTSTRSWAVADMQAGTNSGQGVVANMAARLLVELQYDIAELWQHPAVKTFLRMRRLRLEESAALFAYPLTSIGSYSHISPPASWMRSIDLQNPTIYRQRVCLETPVLPPHLIPL